MPKRLIFLVIDRPPSVGFVQFPTEGGLSQSKKIGLFGLKSFWLEISTWNFDQLQGRRKVLTAGGAKTFSQWLKKAE